MSKFLMGYSTLGTITGGAKEASIDRKTVYNWLTSDTDDFRNLLEEAKSEFVDRLETRLFQQVLEAPNPNPILLMFTLKAHNRAKYGDQVVVTNDKANELLDAVRSLPGVSGVVVEGEVVSGEAEVRRAVEG